ncbi:hypothetical protein EAG_05942 [Camponotus floridanus]|uniref:Uncharacterized protein n=1 Tax=Camponotus floridanus TaxID=104421 RepID=E2AY42_CAMFO|nr:hypothetical protein EAG_05942 [Camponotus floridanus]
MLVLETMIAATEKYSGQFLINFRREIRELASLLNGEHKQCSNAPNFNSSCISCSLTTMDVNQLGTFTVNAPGGFNILQLMGVNQLYSFAYETSSLTEGALKPRRCNAFGNELPTPGIIRGAYIGHVSDQLSTRRGLRKSPVSGLEKFRGTCTRRQSCATLLDVPLFGKPFRDQVYPTRAKSMQTLRQKESAGIGRAGHPKFISLTTSKLELKNWTNFKFANTKQIYEMTFFVCMIELIAISLYLSFICLLSLLHIALTQCSQISYDQLRASSINSSINSIVLTILITILINPQKRNNDIVAVTHDDTDTHTDPVRDSRAQEWLLHPRMHAPVAALSYASAQGRCISLCRIPPDHFKSAPSTPRPHDTASLIPASFGPINQARSILSAREGEERDRKSAQIRYKKQEDDGRIEEKNKDEEHKEHVILGETRQRSQAKNALISIVSCLPIAVYNMVVIVVVIVCTSPYLSALLANQAHCGVMAGAGELNDSDYSYGPRPRHVHPDFIERSSLRDIPPPDRDTTFSRYSTNYDGGPAFFSDVPAVRRPIDNYTHYGIRKKIDSIKIRAKLFVACLGTSAVSTLLKLQGVKDSRAEMGNRRKEGRENSFVVCTPKSRDLKGTLELRVVFKKRTESKYENEEGGALEGGGREREIEFLTLPIFHYLSSLLWTLVAAMGDHLRLASMGNRLSVYRNFAASGSTSGIRRPCNTQTVRVSRVLQMEMQLMGGILYFPAFLRLNVFLETHPPVISLQTTYRILNHNLRNSHVTRDTFKTSEETWRRILLPLQTFDN